MSENKLKIRKSLNKAFLKVKPNRTDIEEFKKNLTQLIDRTNDTESEEFHKNLVSDFLKKTYYEPEYFINTKGRNDLVIHTGKTAKTPVGVIVEAKKPTNKAEMLSNVNINTKAFQELVLYFLRERITHKNLDIKNLIASNINEWFVFDANIFEKKFAQNKKLVKQFEDFEEGRLAGKTTDFFYKEIAQPFIEPIKDEIEFTYFDLRDYEKPLRNEDKKDDTKLIALFKVLSPEHLLKLPFVNDSNSLDKKFYSELLHIIGLTETKEGGKKVIERKKKGERNQGALLENAIDQLDTLDKVNRLPKPSQYGETPDERLFNVGLELSITWVNRILFLKLLEAQLIAYHKGDTNYAFLNFKKIRDYDKLNELFFGVLAKRANERKADSIRDFPHVPYLNSSLFELNEMEHTTISINALMNQEVLPILSNTVLKDANGKKRTGEINALEYFFEFLDAYDFSSEGGEDIQEDNKALINASVLGLIFEKINGYKDGSFFTPGFITMYMCRETIRRSVVQKFNETKGWDCTDLNQLYNKIDDPKEANEIVNSLKICDPAVGSGHFLVSALNEMIAIKNDLKILQDREGRRLKEYHFEVVNDELIVTDEDGEFFEYSPTNKESQRVQESLFHEKQTIIENCLFGVDINPNSVKICRLRLWIELLKNAYYKAENELETLPNIDINIKCGNSLISRFDLDTSISKILKGKKWNVSTYKIAVESYKNARNKEEKHEFERLIEIIKQDFRTEIAKYSDRDINELNKKSAELFSKYQSEQLYTQKLTKKQNEDRKKLEKKISELTQKIEEKRNNPIYENAFEWRFEFPEVLNEQGDFIGFDTVIGNPPYIRQEAFLSDKPYLQGNYETATGTADLFVYFVERGMQILTKNGQFVYILPNKWMRAGYGKNLRNWVGQFAINSIIDFGDLPVFEEATTYPCIWQMSKTPPTAQVFESSNIETLAFSSSLSAYVKENKFEVNQSLLSENGWTLVYDRAQRLLEKIKGQGKPLGEYVEGRIFRGVLTGYNEAFVIDATIRTGLIAEDPKSEEIIKPFLAGRDIKRYQQPKSDRFLIFTRRGIEIENYPAVLNYLGKYKESLEPKPKDYKGEWKGRKPGNYKWYEIQDAVDYYDEFEKEKILWPGISFEVTAFAYDNEAYFGNDNTQMIITNEKPLLALLNSRVTKFFLNSTCDFVRGGFARLKIAYVDKVPICFLSDDDRVEIESKISQILHLKKSDPNADTSKLEAEIDQMVYQLYGLTEEEIAIVEEAVK